MVLGETASTLGFRVITFDTVGSTNDEALARARDGDLGRLWIRAREQARGRGRGGRPWSSPPGNLYATLLLVDPAEPRYAPQLGLMAGLALARAVLRFPGVPNGVAIKWPNDLLHDGAKLAGILVEGTQLRSGSFAAAIGFGVNCRSHPTPVDYPATDLSTLTGRDVDPAVLLSHLSTELDKVLATWNRGRGFRTIREGWLSHALPPGSRLVARLGTRSVDGRFETIDDEGRLVLRTGTGPAVIDAADIFHIRETA